MGSRIAVLNNGMLQQMDTPFNLYHNPCNIFVAGFIGSPAMNFFDANVKRDDGQTLIETRQYRFALPASLEERYANRLPRNLVLGIRPEDIDTLEYQPPDTNPFIISASVTNTEMMGHEVVLEVELGEQTIIVRTDPRTSAKVGQHIDLALNLDNLHLFDSETGEALAYKYQHEAKESIKPEYVAEF